MPKNILLYATFGLVAIVVAVSASFLTAYTSQHQQEPEAVPTNISLRELANSLTPIYPEVTLSGEEVTTVDGIALRELDRTVTSETTQWDENGRRVPLLKDGQAELTSSYARAANGDDIVVGTITNIGTARFYLIELVIIGGVANGVAPLSTEAVSAGWTPEVHPGVPQPPAIEPLIVEPGESVSAMIAGKWNVPHTSTVIDTFEVGAIYAYDIQGVTTEDPVYGWGMGLGGLKVP
jgi:hypothetical protein